MELRRIVKPVRLIHVRPRPEDAGEGSSRGAAEPGSSGQPPGEESIPEPQPGPSTQQHSDPEEVTTVGQRTTTRWFLRCCGRSVRRTHCLEDENDGSEAEIGAALQQAKEEEQVVPEQDSFSSMNPESQPLPGEQRRWRMPRCLSILIAFVTNIPPLTLLHWLLTFGTVVMLFFGLVIHSWRVIQVDRESLMTVRDSEEMDGLLWNSSITFTRSQFIFWECFVDNDLAGDFGTFYRTSFSIRDVDQNSSFERSRCHRILNGVQAPDPPSDKQGDIISNMKAEMVLCPIVLFIAMITVVMQILSEFCNDRRLVFLTINVVMRTLNTFHCFIVVTCSLLLDYHFQAADPSFPRSWPKVVRDLTKVQTWQTGAVDWMVGTLFQVCALALDLRRVVLRD